MTLTRALVDAPAYLRTKWQTSRALQAAAWSTSLFVAGQIVRVAANLVVARLLAPEMFGVMSIVLIIQLIIAMLCDIGLLPIVMRSKHGDEEDFLNTVWSVQMLRGLGIWIAGLFVALAVYFASKTSLISASSVWHAPELPAVMAVVLFSSVIRGLQSTKFLSAYRHMNVKQLALIEFAGQIISIVVMVTVAIATRSIWAFAVAALVAPVVSTLLSHFWLPGPLNRLAWNRTALAEIYESGGWILLGSLLTTVAASADRLLMAGYVDAKTLGLYAIALNLIVMIDVFGQRLVGFVLQPQLNIAVRDNPGALRTTLLRQRLVFDAGLLFVSGSLFASSQSLIAIMYDPRYVLAGHILQVLSLLFILSRYTLIMGQVYVAIGRPQLNAIFNAVKLISILILVPLGYHYAGFDGALLAVALHQLPCVAVIFWFNKALDLNDFRLELQVLPAWLAGYGAGYVLAGLLGLVQR